MDLVGADISQHVSGNLYEAIPHDPFREHLLGPIKDLTDRMVEHGFLGNKSGQGFYKKVKGADGKKTYQVLDLKTMAYRDQQKPEIPVIAEAKKIKSLGERFRFLVEQEDRYGRLIWHDASFSFSYCSHLIPEISDSLYGIDDAMKSGFMHRMGPFEIWDALGVSNTMARMENDGFAVAPWVKDMLKSGASSFYKKEGNAVYYWDTASASYKPVPVDPFILLLADRKNEGYVIKENPSASLIDLGDGVLCVEFHTKMNSLDPDILNMCDRALEEIEKDHVGLVIGNQGGNFCAGANILAIVMAAENKQWDYIEKAIKDMQDKFLRLRYSPKPVVAAPFGMTLGGGAEVAMAADRICASAETYMGMVEVGVGLVPAGGGCSQMIQRVISPAMKMANSDPLPFLMKVFETVAMAKVSGSAAQAGELGFLKESDQLVMNGDHLLNEAKRLVLEISAAGYTPPAPTKSVYAVGARGMAFLSQGVTSMVWSRHISEYDKHIGQKLAYILSGGSLSAPQWVPEQYILDLEREVFLSLCGEEKTIARIKHMLTTGRPLRN
jgi:3-hydroxyacyl-CoA dehydrogenase